jgi:hypothetical protein
MIKLSKEVIANSVNGDKAEPQAHKQIDVSAKDTSQLGRKMGLQNRGSLIHTEESNDKHLKAHEDDIEVVSRMLCSVGLAERKGTGAKASLRLTPRYIDLLKKVETGKSMSKEESEDLRAFNRLIGMLMHH